MFLAPLFLAMPANGQKQKIMEYRVQRQGILIQKYVLKEKKGSLQDRFRPFLNSEGAGIVDTLPTTTIKQAAHFRGRPVYLFPHPH